MSRITWSAWLVFSVFTLLLAPGCPAHAHGVYSVSVEDEWGGPLRTFEQGGSLYVLASYGQRYVIVLRNNSGRRVEAVVSVDGRDVVSGRVGDFMRERGYVLAPYSTLRIDGFRKSYQEVAAFRFSAPEASYSARMGTPENVGVIGAAFFPERVRPVPPPPRPVVPVPQRDDYGSSYERERREAPAKSSAGSQPSAAPAAAADSYAGSGSARGAAPASESVNNLGTEYGEARESRVEEVRFVRASSSPAHVAVLHYDDAQGLLARGIELEPRRVSYREPQAFPRNRFAPPPP